MSSRRESRVGAFFDMDKTLIAENSGSLYMKHRYEQKEIDGWELAKGALAYLRYKAGLLDIAAWTRQAMLQFEGESEAELERQADDWTVDKVVQHVYPEAREAVRWHQAQGHVVAIVSGATRFVVGPLAKHLGIDHFLYTRLEVVDGRFTGQVIEPVCFERGKIHWLEQLVSDQNIDLARSWFYTDSITDLPLLELVGHPVVTNPDPRLYREAVRRRWPVRFFTPPDAAEVPEPLERAPGAPKKPRRRKARSATATEAGS